MKTQPPYEPSQAAKQPTRHLRAQTYLRTDSRPGRRIRCVPGGVHLLSLHSLHPRGGQKWSAWPPVSAGRRLYVW